VTQNAIERQSELGPRRGPERGKGMPEQATERLTIDAPPQRCFEVAADFERYPEWARDVKEARVVEEDNDGRAIRVAFRAGAMGHSARYILRYDYADAPRTLAWRLVQGDIVRVLDGEYVFEPSEADGQRTDVTYHLEVELAVPLPGFIKRRAESKIMTTALDELKRRVEQAYA
jgi:ribosome-associated toxin RatA of RatAB toxin-antitoxin module